MKFPLKPRRVRLPSPRDDAGLRPLRRALLSVSDKAGLVEFARALAALKVELLSTGGTAALLREAGLKVTDVAEHTGFPEMLDGRVKTLHPVIHGGLLGKRDDRNHQQAMKDHDIAPIDLVVVNLYPFEQAVEKGCEYDECIENIDIGGPAMIRSAAKNHADVAVVVDPRDYARVTAELKEHSGYTSRDLRRELAKKAYSRTAAYDSAISQWFSAQLEPDDNPFPKTLTVVAKRRQILRYGENPHQQAAWYVWPGTAEGLAAMEQVQGKELSYNNLNDTDAAFALVQEFLQPAVAIIKHANPCGVAVAETQAEAFRKALACDPQSAFGGIIALNRPLDAETVEAIGSLFVEVIIAPEATREARALLEKKKNLRLLVAQTQPVPSTQMLLRPIAGGLLLQEEDREGMPDIGSLRTVTHREPGEREMQDLRIAFTVAKHVKSNAIVLVKDGATIGIGAGQMSRVDSVRIAVLKAQDAGLEVKGAVLASDAFFPFDDNIHLAAKYGIAALIQPGGSMRDDEVIAAANQHGMAMVTTGVRHFRH